MKRVVLDTNVLISATFWTGASFRVLKLIEQGKVNLILSKAILQEYDKIVHSDEIIHKAAYQQQRIASVQKVLQLAILVEPKEQLNIIKDDPDDDKFLEAAAEGAADYLVTQDKKHILPLKEFRKTKIITPEEFLAQSE
jgi:putative PIN family toxin of toxin-antitoxin system